LEAVAVRGERSFPPDLEQWRDQITLKLSAQGIEVGRLVDLLPQKEAIADDPRKVLVETLSGEPQAVLIVAPPSAPEIAMRGAKRAREAARMLGPGLGSVVLQPVASGWLAGLSYAVVPWQRRLTDSRWLWRLQRVWITRLVLRWLTRVVEVTASELPEERFFDQVRPLLEALASDQRFADRVRRDVEFALARLSQGSWRPKTVLVHNDLWKGNILLPSESDTRRSSPFGFYLIDWAGAALPGFPFWDFARVSMSLRVPNPWARYVALRHCKILGCEPADAVSSLLLAIADLGAKLDCMPVENYLQTADKVHRFLRGVLFVEGESFL
jgi:hypothetical protein